VTVKTPPKVAIRAPFWEVLSRKTGAGPPKQGLFVAVDARLRRFHIWRNMRARKGMDGNAGVGMPHKV
jgi:hypothetical protein